MNIFDASHALMEIEERLAAAHVPENQFILFYMWLSEDKFPGHTFDDAFISKVLRECRDLIKEFDEWAHKEAMESLLSPQDLP